MTNSAKTIHPMERQPSAGEQVASAALALLIGLSTSPWVQPPGADREFYRYVGMLWAKGGVPYRDVFDIKPPLVFLAAWGGSAWVLWWIINLTMALAAGMLCGALKRFRVPQPVLWTGMALVLMRLPTIVEGGGLSYELSAAFCAMFVAQAIHVEPFYVGLGTLLGLVALTQQSDLVGLVPFCVALAYRSGQFVDTVLRMAFGAALVLGVAIFYFVNRGALLAWWQDTWMFPFLYFSNLPLALPDRVAALGRAFWATRLLPFVVWAVALQAWEAIMGREPIFTGGDDAGDMWGDIVALALAFQVVAICVAGKFYGHYFLSFVVYLILFMGAAWRAGMRCLPQVHSRRGVLVGASAGVLLFGLAAVTSPRVQYKMLDAWHDAQRTVAAWRGRTTPYDIAMARDRAMLADARNQDGQIFVFRGYGRPMALYADLQVRAPTRYVHTLFWDSTSRGAEELDAVLQDLDQERTRYVLDYSESKPLRDRILQLRWNVYRDAHYKQGMALMCDGGTGMAQNTVCGHLYTRRA